GRAGLAGVQLLVPVAGRRAGLPVHPDQPTTTLVHASPRSLTGLARFREEWRDLFAGPPHRSTSAPKYCRAGVCEMTGYPSLIVPAGHVEPCPRRVRGVFAGRTVFDTGNARYVWER